MADRSAYGEVKSRLGCEKQRKDVEKDKYKSPERDRKKKNRNVEGLLIQWVKSSLCNTCQ